MNVDGFHSAEMNQAPESLRRARRTPLMPTAVTRSCKRWNTKATIC